MRLVFAGIGVLVLVGLVVTLIFAVLFSRDVARKAAWLSAEPPGSVRQDLPPVVEAFAQRGLAGAAPAAALRLEQSAEMRLKPGADWTSLSARQTIGVARPGFAWVATMRAGPLPLVRVLDSYVDGEGVLEVRLFSAYRLDATQGPEAALGEGLRYLAELPWAPDAILVNREIMWEVSGAEIVARLETAGGTAEVVFQLDAAGDVVAVTASGRPATLPDGSIAPLDWRGAFSDYAQIGGRRIPTLGEVGYVYPDGYESYFKGRITDLVVVD
jgi:Family of unknown function (DUF6544)